jgi:hypothetical protein
MAYDPLGLYSESPTSSYDPLGLFGDTAKQPTEYNALRSGAVDLVESAVGVGDELDAAVRVLSGEAESWKQALSQSQAELDAFEKANPVASKVITGVGLAGSLFIPALGMSKLAQAGSTAARVAKGAGLTAAEGAAYGYLVGRGEDRAESALIGGALGGVLGGAATKFLTKGADEVTDVVSTRGKDTFIGGDEGFVSVGKAKEDRGIRSSADTSTQERKVKRIVDDALQYNAKTGQSGTLGDVLLSTKEWIAKNVGQRAAKLAEDSETMIRRDLREIDEVFDTTFKGVADIFENNKALKSLSVRMNKNITEDNRATWDMMAAAARTPEEKEAVELLKQQIKTLQHFDFVKADDIDYFPTKFLRERAVGGVARPDDYANPVLAVKELAEDISSARALATRFGLDINNIRAPKTGESRLDLVIKEIEKQAKKQGASSDVAANLGNGLRSQLIASKRGGNTVGAVARRVTSSALLANPMNAILNISEGITAPIYQNGVKAWAKTLPRAIVATFSEQAGIKNPNWLANKQLGLDREFMGELANTGQKAMNDAAESASWTKLSDKAVGGLDKTGKALYTLSGVRKVNRMGQEILSNSAVQRGMDLAKKGDAKSLEKLRKHEGMRGLTDSEFKATVDALKRGSLDNPWVVTFAGSSMNKWQPVSAAAMPKAFHDNPNGRMFYSMLSYMNKQMNSLRTDVGLNMVKAQELGINSKEGAAAMREAMKNSAKYAALFGVFAGIWDDGRKTLDLSSDRELEDLLTPDGISKAALNQISSNMTGGLYNMRAEQYGGLPVQVSPAPLTAAFRVGSGLFQAGEGLAAGETPSEALTPLLRATQTYVPVASNIDKILRMTTGERLFEDFIE